MLSGDGNENGQNKISRSRLGKRQFCRVQHNFFFCTFLCRCYARLRRETSRNFLVTRFMEKMSYVFPFPFFFTAAHNHSHLVAASISHFLSHCQSKNFIFPHSQRNWSPLLGAKVEIRATTLFNLQFWQCCFIAKRLPVLLDILMGQCKSFTRAHV